MPPDAREARKHDATFARSHRGADFPCRLCGESRLVLHYAQGNAAQYRYFRCPCCALVNYDLAGGIDQTQYMELTDPRNDGAGFNVDKDQSWAFVERWIKEPGRLLDIGCGNGRLLYLAKRAGWDVKGLELSETMAAHAAAAVNVPVMVGDFLTDLPGEDAGYDLVSLRHVLEHLVDPVLALSRINELLSPGGYCLVEMPNIEAADKRLKRFALNIGLRKRRYAEDFVPGHCNEFCRRSFDHLLQRTGFELMRWETYSKKPLANFLLNRIPVGNKARALVRKTAEGR